MAENKDFEIQPVITIEWDIWDQTWVLHRTMKYSERYNVPVTVTLHPGSMTIVLEVLGHVANIIEVGLFISVLITYLRRKSEEKDIPFPKLNTDAAVALAINRLREYEGIKAYIPMSIRQIDNGFEITFRDFKGKLYRFIVNKDGEYEYFKL